MFYVDNMIWMEYKGLTCLLNSGVKSTLNADSNPKVQWVFSKSVSYHDNVFSIYFTVSDTCLTVPWIQQIGQKDFCLWNIFFSSFHFSSPAQNAFPCFSWKTGTPLELILEGNLDCRGKVKVKKSCSVGGNCSAHRNAVLVPNHCSAPAVQQQQYLTEFQSWRAKYFSSSACKGETGGGLLKKTQRKKEEVEGKAWANHIAVLNRVKPF